MILLQEFEDFNAALAFAEFLNTQGVGCIVEKVGDHGAVVLKDERTLKVAQVELARFLNEPNHSRYMFAPGTTDLRTEVRDLDGMSNRLRYGLQTLWEESGWLTRSVGIISILVFFATGFGASNSGLSHFEFFSSVDAMFGVELWRWVTPVFIHYLVAGLPLHILFNLMWWWELGGFVERFQSSKRLLLVFTIVAVVSNMAQFFSSGNNFGGLSGVVYGLLGYLWFYGRVYPASGVQLNPKVLSFMIAWLVICFTGFVGPVANAAHLGGLLTGSLLAIIFGGKDRSQELINE
ncbi:hypothetical protein A9Q99_05110 [Gammaproteobacteria bacterium 45_16_T64]|nr:hypothetical protein A9Q99_05110 [Gammaproteobacteria bacterium 45_16_T64]